MATRQVESVNVQRINRVKKNARQKSFKIVIGGPVDVGKTQFITTLSDSKAVHTEVDVISPYRSAKDTTRVAMDIAIIRLNSHEIVELYGMPGQMRFEFIPEAIAEGIQGIIFVVDSTSLADTVQPRLSLEDYKNYYQAPVVVCVNKQDLANSLSPESARGALGLPQDVPVLPLCALQKESALSALKALLDNIKNRPVKVVQAKIDRPHQLLYTLGKGYLARQEFVEAYNKFEQLFAIDNNNADIACNLAMAGIGLKDVSERGLEFYKRAVELNSKSRKLLLGLSALFVQENVRTPFAVRICEKAVKILPDGDNEISSFLRKQHDKVKNGLSKAKRTPAASYSAELISGQIEKMWWAHQFPQAIDLLRKAYEDYPTYKDFDRMLALTYTFQSFSEKRMVEDIEQSSVVYREFRNTKPTKSIEELRDCVALASALPKNIPGQKLEPELEEYRFILGLIPMEDFFNEQCHGSSAQAIGEFDPVDAVLSRLNKIKNPENDDPVSISDLQSCMLVQIQNYKEVPQKIRTLLGEEIAAIPGSLLYQAADVFVSLATEPLEQLRTVVALLKRLEAHGYGLNSPSTHRYPIHCTLSCFSVTDGSSEKTILESIFYGTHLLGLIDKEPSAMHPVGRILLHVDKAAIEQLEGHDFSVSSPEKIEIRPAKGIEYAELVWSEPLARVSSERSYRFNYLDIQEVLGRHQHYSTYLANDRRLGRRVIAKIIPPRESIDYKKNESEILALYDRIAKIARMSHPNIATVFEMGEHDHMLFCFREYVDGKPLSEFTFSEPEWEQTLVASILKAVRALIYAQSNGISHLNLNPRNIWLTGLNGIKIVDFYVAGFRNGRADAGQVIPETRRYMAPEILAGEAGDMRSDIFSLGVIINEILSQSSNDAGTSPDDSLEKLNGSIKESRRHVNKKWQPLVMRAAHPDKNKRFQTFREMELELRQIQLEIVSQDF